jgi:hypothetical protein
MTSPWTAIDRARVLAMAGATIIGHVAAAPAAEPVATSSGSPALAFRARL